MTFHMVVIDAVATCNSSSQSSSGRKFGEEISVGPLDLIYMDFNEGGNAIVITALDDDDYDLFMVYQHSNSTNHWEPKGSTHRIGCDGENVPVLSQDSTYSTDSHVSLLCYL